MPQQLDWAELVRSKLLMKTRLGKGQSLLSGEQCEPIKAAITTLFLFIRFLAIENI